MTTRDAQQKTIERWMGGVDEKLGNLSNKVAEESQDAKHHRDGLRDVIASLSISVQGLTKEVADQKPLAAGLLELRGIVTAQVGMVNTLGNRIAALEPDVLDYREKRAEARGVGKFVTWLRGIVIAAIGAGGGYLASHFAK